MRLLLVDPVPPFDVYKKAVVTAPVCPSLTLAMLGGAAREAGHTVRILDLRLEAEPDRVFRETLLAYEPQIVGFTAYTFTYKTILRLAALVRETLQRASIVLGGVHAQVLSADDLRNTPFDFVVLGEGERTLQDILSGRPGSEILGLWYRTGKEFVRTPPRPLIADLDELNYPAYDLFDRERYNLRNLLWRTSRIAMLESSRGCPFACIFCTSGLVFGPRFRAKSPEQVVAEIRHLLDMGFTEIHFQDDGFTTDLARAKEICRSIISSGLRFPWELYNGIRVDRVDGEFLSLAARAGCYRIRFGVESGNQGILDNIGKRLKLDEVRRAFALARQYDIETIALFMLGLPGETPATLEDTIRFAVELPCDFARASIAIPFPGSPLYDRWKREGRILSDNTDDYHFHRTGELIARHPTLSGEDIHRAYDRFYRRFYVRPSYWWERLRLGFRRGTLLRDLSYFMSKFMAKDL